MPDLKRIFQSKTLRQEKEAEEKNEEEQNTTTLQAAKIYDFYFEELLPALFASLPILLHRLGSDVKYYIVETGSKVAEFILPDPQKVATNLNELWDRRPQTAESLNEFFLAHFDTNGDGHIHPSELVNMTEIIARLEQQRGEAQNFWVWLSREWPLFDWKVGVFLWRTFGGILLALAILSIIPGRLHSLSGKILRWPILFITYVLITVELLVYIVIRLVIRVAETIIAKPKHRQLRAKMAKAESYEQWYEHAAALDVSQKRDRWQQDCNDSTGYRHNWHLIRQLMSSLKEARRQKDSLKALAVLRQCTRKNVGGVMSEDLFSYTNTGEPKFIVKEFIDEVTTTLNWITDEALSLEHPSQSEDDENFHYEKTLDKKVKNEKEKLWKSVMAWAALSFHEDDPNRAAIPREIKGSGDSVGSTLEDKPLPSSTHKQQLIEFLKAGRSAYGRTALCLSGGAAMGSYHFGHLKGLIETDCLPQIISGTSAGSAIGALVCTRTKEELEQDLKPEIISKKLKFFVSPWGDRIKSLIKNGYMFAYEDWRDMVRWFTMDLTFEEAYRKTGRTFCITLASTTKKAPPVLINHISAPNVTIASAVVASAAVPGFVAPVRLQLKDSAGVLRSAGEETYYDGSIQTDIPIAGLSEMLNCQFFIACQANPHVVPFFFDSKGAVGRPSRWSSGEQAWSWRGGFLLAALELYLKNDMKAKFVFLNDLEAAVGFTSTMMTQQFHGSTTIVPQVQFKDYFTLFADPSTEMIDRCMQVGSVAAYQHAAMIRSHYRIADTIDECLRKLGCDEDARPTRRTSFEAADKISKAMARLRRPSFSSKSMPDIISAALKERLAEGDSTDMSDDNSVEQ
eukprot:scaffold2533_cov137-Cylindrotheca_fusiformis.AAC.10